MSKKLEEAFEAYKNRTDRRAREMTYENFLQCCKDCGIVDGRWIREEDIEHEYKHHRPRGGRWDYKCFRECLMEIAKKRLKGEDPKNIYEMVEGHMPHS